MITKPREIVRVPDPVLRRVCDEVAIPIDEDVTEMAIDLLEVLHSDALFFGLAAPQLGFTVRMFVLKPYPQPFINPVLVKVGPTLESRVEACLSIPDTLVTVERPTTCVIEATSLLGDRKKWKMRLKDARAALHELDHLDGKLITDYA